MYNIYIVFLRFQQFKVKVFSFLIYTILERPVDPVFFGNLFRTEKKDIGKSSKEAPAILFYTEFKLVSAKCAATLKFCTERN